MMNRFSRQPFSNAYLVKCYAMACGLLIAQTLTTSSALAQSQLAQPAQVAQYKAWRVFTLGAGTTKACYIVSEPVQKAPKNARRGEIFISLAHRPGQGVYDEVSVRIGYPFSSKSNPYARIGSNNYSFFTGAKMGGTSSAWAWMKNPAEHQQLVKAMRQGNQLIFKGRSKRDTLTTDSYSLLGFTAAKKKMDELCPQ